jgi:hypothetical protein
MLANPYGPGQQGGWPQQPGPPQQPQYHAQPAYRPQPPTGRRLDNDKGFFGSLFDFSFDNFIAPKLVKFLYVLAMIFTTIYSIALLIAGLVQIGRGGGGVTLAGLLLIVLSPLVWLIGLIVTRLYLELAIVMFKISDDIKDIRDNGAIR